mmetsp:Transcript_27282/g.38371  ORF Transcript_27282/g.38371 Transcript_27282/m.38371 type:complete len:84 (+) Transcript_27282:24-275(+)
MQNRVNTPMIGGSMTSRRGGPWPECVGESVEDCIQLIKESNLRKQRDIEIIYSNSKVKSDFQPNRVRIYVDDDELVEKIPKLG